MSKLRPRASTRLVGHLALAWLLVLAGTWFAVRPLVLAGLLLGLVCLRAAWVRAHRVQGSFDVQAAILREGDALPFSVQSQGGPRRPAPMQWRLRLPAVTQVLDGSNCATILARGTRQHKGHFEAQFPLFGVQEVGPLEIRSSDPFGLVFHEGEVAPAILKRVRPRFEELRDGVVHSKQQRPQIGVFEINRAGNAFDFFGLRDYVVGDRPRDINWKASARRGQIIVNQYQRDNDSEIVLLVDARDQSLVGHQAQAPYRRSVRASLAIAAAHLRARDAVRLVVYGRDLGQDNHTGPDRQINGMVDLLTELAPGGSEPLEDVLHRVLPSMRPRSPVVLLSSLVGDPTVAASVALLASRDHPLTVMAPQPDWGRHAKSSASRAWSEEQDRLVRQVRSLGVRVMQPAAGEDIAVTIASLRWQVAA